MSLDRRLRFSNQNKNSQCFVIPIGIAWWIFAVSLSSSAQQGKVSDSCFYSRPQLRISKDIQFLKGQEQSYLKTIKKTDQLLCEFKKYNPLVISLSKKGENAYFSFIENKIETVVQFEKYESGKLANPQQGLSILMHEYTHSVYAANMEADSKVYANFKRMEKKSIEILMSRQILMREFEETDDEKRKKDIEVLYQILEEEAQKLPRYTTAGYYLAIRAMNEYFADVVAVVQTKNPRAVYQALLGDNVVTPRESVVIRDFAKNYGPMQLSRWLPSIKLMVDLGVKQGNIDSGLYYRGLAPLRGYTWELIKGPVQNEKNHPKILRTIYKTLAQELDREFAVDIPVEKIDFKKWNIDLFIAIQQALQREGLI